MLYSRKVKLDRRNSVMAAVKKELKAKNAYVAPEMLKELADKLNTALYYGIEVIRDAEEAAKRLCLLNQETQHSWAGGDGTKEDGEVVSGELSFGEEYSYEYFDNGNSQGADTSHTDAEFDINKPFVVFIDRHDWRDWERDACNHDDRFHIIVIYSPEKIYDEAEYVAEKNARLETLCQLRASNYNLPKAAI